MDPAVVDLNNPVLRRRGIAQASSVLPLGELVVLPTGGAYALAGDLQSARARTSLDRLRGGPPPRATPILVGTWAAAEELAVGLSEAVINLVRAFWPGGLTVVLTARGGAGGSTPAGAHVALRMPLHPVALEVINNVGPLLTAHPRALPDARCDSAGPSALDIRHALGRGAAYTYLEAGPQPSKAISTVLDCTHPDERVTLLRSGAVTRAQLASVLGDTLVVPAHRPSKRLPPSLPTIHERLL